ncbi:hypothetical protein BDR22DRAFT_831702 [Usnea florida]
MILLDEGFRVMVTLWDGVKYAALASSPRIALGACDGLGTDERGNKSKVRCIISASVLKSRHS